MICPAVCQQKLLGSGDFWKSVTCVGTEKEPGSFWKTVFQLKELKTCQSGHMLLKFLWFNALGQDVGYLRQWQKTLCPSCTVGM